jgi:hypothetical protein
LVELEAGAVQRFDRGVVHPRLLPEELLAPGGLLLRLGEPARQPLERGVALRRGTLLGLIDQLRQPPAPFVEAVEQGLEATEAEARRRLTKLVAQAKERASAERDASLKRLTRWLSQTKAKPAQSEKVLQEESRIHDAAIAALDGARLELDQSALVQLL